jgi:hypothetical protein
MIFKIFNMLIIVIIGAFLLGHHEKASGDPTMICQDKDRMGKVAQTCGTKALNDHEADIICDLMALDPSVHLLYTCKIITRDWAPPSPYAHVSRIWHCTSGDLKKLLFDQDFSNDAIRCRLVCGPCDRGWQPE